MLKKFIKPGVYTLIGFIFLASPKAADSGVIVSRMDSYLEQIIIALQLENNNYIKDVLTNLDDLRAIKRLANLHGDVRDIQNLQKKFISVKTSNATIVKRRMRKMRNTNTMSIGDIATSLNKGKYKGTTLTKASGGSGNNISDDTALSDYFETTGLNGDAGAIVVERAEETLKVVVEEGDDDSSVSSSDVSDEAIAEALVLQAETVPMSHPSMQRAATDIIGTTTSSIEEKKLYASNIADASRSNALGSISALMAPYMLKEGDGSYRAVINKIEEQSQEAIEKTTDLASGGPSQALRTIAALSAVQVEQSALQNQLLITMIDMLADEIKMMGINAMLNVEGYTQGLNENLQRYIEVQEFAGVAD